MIVTNSCSYSLLQYTVCCCSGIEGVCGTCTDGLELRTFVGRTLVYRAKCNETLLQASCDDVTYSWTLNYVSEVRFSQPNKFIEHRCDLRDTLIIPPTTTTVTGIPLQHHRMFIYCCSHDWFCCKLYTSIQIWCKDVVVLASTATSDNMLLSV